MENFLNKRRGECLLEDLRYSTLESGTAGRTGIAERIQIVNQLKMMFLFPNTISITVTNGAAWSIEL